MYSIVLFAIADVGPTLGDMIWMSGVMVFNCMVSQAFGYAVAAWITDPSQVSRLAVCSMPALQG